MDRFNLVGCLPFDGRHIGFYMPVFIAQDRQGSYIQKIGSDWKSIEDFDLLEDDLGELVDLQTGFVARRGEHPVYVFRGESFHVGYLPDIKDAIHKYAATSKRPSILLEFAELFGSHDEKRVARAQALQNLRNNMAHTQTHTYFTTSLFIHSLWDNVLAGLREDANKSDIAALRQEILFHSRMNDPDIIPDGVWAKLEPLILFGRDELRDRVLSELPVDSSELSVFSADAASGPDERTLADALQRLKRVGRQEERLAIILDELIERPKVGEFLLSTHKDRGNMAREGMKLIRRNIAHLDTREQREAFVARLIRRLFTLSFTFSRGETLYYLSLHLGKHETVARAIRGKVSESRARNVWELRGAIDRALASSANA